MDACPLGIGLKGASRLLRMLVGLRVGARSVSAGLGFVAAADAAAS